MEKRSFILKGFLFIRWMLGGLFVYAGTSKLLNPAAFSLEITHYQILPAWGAAMLAVYLPWLEMIAGILVIIRKWILSALGILFALILTFLIAISSAWLRGLDISCGCFGHTFESVPYIKIITRDLLLLILILTQILHEKHTARFYRSNVHHHTGSGR